MDIRRDLAGSPTLSVDSIRHADRGAVAMALNLIDDARPAARAACAELFTHLPEPEGQTRAQLIGMTGAPGAGKSSLVARLVETWRAQGHTVGVLATDPSSPFTGGALLGDRFRMDGVAEDRGVFVRSLASREAFGGLCREVWPMAVVMLAAFDRVIVETVGVGQRDVDVTFAVDLTCLALPPAAGDVIQFMKAGIMEIPDVIATTKADLASLAAPMPDAVSATTGLAAVPVVQTSAARGHGIDEVIQILDRRHARIVASGQVSRRRLEARQRWIARELAEEFGRYGLDRIGGEARVLAAFRSGSTPGHSPPSSLFAQHAYWRDRILSAFDGPGPRGHSKRSSTEGALTTTELDHVSFRS